MPARAALVVLAGTMLAGCIGVRVEPVVAPTPEAVPNVYGLTDWHTNLAVTTCAEFADSMTPADQVAAAAWILAISRRVEVSDASDGAEFAGRFVGQIVAACAKYYGSDPTTSVIAGAGMAYYDDPSLHPAHH